MENKNANNIIITPQKEDFGKWFIDVCKQAEIFDFSLDNHFFIYRPYGYALWEETQKYLNKRLKDSMHDFIFMPSNDYLSIQSDDFSKNIILDDLKKESLNKSLCANINNEFMICNHFKNVVSFDADLPKLYSQMRSSFNADNWKENPTTNDFLSIESHTIHENDEEARTESLKILDIYEDLGSQLLAIPFIKGKRIENKELPSEIETYVIESIIKDGRSMRCGVSQYYGQIFSNIFDIKYENKNKENKYPYQTFSKISSRLIDLTIMIHGDDKGLVLPPFIAPIQLIIVPFKMEKPGVLSKARELEKIIRNAGIRVKLDSSNKSNNDKFVEYDLKGVPLRLEIGPKDINKEQVTLYKRNDGNKIVVSFDELINKINKLIKLIQKEMYEKAYEILLNQTYEVNSLDELDDVINNKLGYAKVMWCGQNECLDEMKKVKKATPRCLPFNQIGFSDVCPVCKKKANKVVFFAKSY